MQDAPQRFIANENRIKEHWRNYLPLVQNIINYTITIGTQPARVIFEDMIGLDLQEGTTA